VDPLLQDIFRSRVNEYGPVGREEISRAPPAFWTVGGLLLVPYVPKVMGTGDTRSMERGPLCPGGMPGVRDSPHFWV
jgi:hypothetical protein